MRQHLRGARGEPKEPERTADDSEGSDEPAALRMSAQSAVVDTPFTDESGQRLAATAVAPIAMPYEVDVSETVTTKVEASSHAPE